MEMNAIKGVTNKVEKRTVSGNKKKLKHRVPKNNFRDS
jgi:hypothetical protein